MIEKEIFYGKFNKMEELLNILQSNLFLGLLVLLIIVPLYVKLGIIGKKNGNGNGKNPQVTELQTQMDTMQNNHLSHIAEKLDKIIEQNQEQLFILRDIKDNQK